MADTQRQTGLFGAAPAGGLSSADELFVETSGAPHDLSETVADLIDAGPARGPAATADLREYLTATIAGILAGRGAEPRHVCWPRLDILAPASEALRYSGNRHAFAALIAASMDARRRDHVLPAFVEILKQMSGDELDILRRLPSRGRFTPVADIIYSFANGQVLTAHRNVLPPDYADGCTVPSNIPVYVDNLERLRIVMRPREQSAPADVYEDLLRQPFVAKLFEEAPAHAMGTVDHGLLGLTDLGEAFRGCCV